MLEVGRRDLVLQDLTGEIIRCAMQVHRVLGPGLLESVYDECLTMELVESGRLVARQVPIPVVYRGRALQSTFRADLIVDDAVVVELKAVDRLLPIHEAQLLTYLKLTELRVGLLLNFNVPTLRSGIRRIVL